MRRPESVFVISRRRTGYHACVIGNDGVGCLRLPGGPSETADVGLARTLIFEATGDGQLADDWCASFALEVAAASSRKDFSLCDGEVSAWLERVA